MRFHQREIWRHGSCFLVRQVQSRSAGHVDLMTDTYQHGVPMPPRVIFYRGRFLARVDSSLVKRWIEYYARNLLTTGRPT